ncbi:MAG: RluA family pseudouridine synthase [Candidatus Cloacimonetes bacterium]|nr:RluA family pseudouridine synthase [Candidatus Cloacimonadota bacterium]MDD2506681.1 RluA family pseudouridine synthase [Candidatus Cloacimonadota bacterium]MDD4148080.1 RluA family pseudouridine synthase [Candidatus Cloacimonadota bacterium]MDD4559955.1 RluA family pseudouridine synthase [Candidatus Cloacimonadota bacterium]
MNQQKIRIVYEGDEPIRLDKHLANLRLQELHSRSFIESLITEDRILVNNVPVKKSYPLNKGDEISLKLPDPPDYNLNPEDIPLDVVYEDDYLAVVNKAAGMIVHPGHGNPDGTLVNAILYRFGSNLSSGSDNNRPGIVHRLDRGTSGLIIIAKTDSAQAELNHMFARREIHKTYLTITSGIPEPSEGSIECHIGRSLSNPRQMCVTDAGKWSLSHYKIIKYYHYFALVKVKLETGRMHQIRVQFAHHHVPLLGDLLYNTRRQVHSLMPQNMKRKATELLANHLLRQALHSWRLEFIHPITKEHLDIFAPLPEDILYTLDWLEKYFSIDTDSKPYNMILEENIQW